MAKFDRREVVTGVFVIAAVALFAWISFKSEGFDAFAVFRPEPVRYVATFDNAKGLDKGARVTSAGRQVGRVRDVRFVESTVDADTAEQLRELLADAAPPEGSTRQIVSVEFEIADRQLRLDPGTARARITQNSLLGGYSLTVDAGYWHGASPPPAAAPGESIAIKSADGGDINAVVARLAPAIERANAILARVDDELMSDENIEYVGAAIQNLEAATAEIRAMVDSDNVGGVQRMLVQPANRFIENADQSVAALRERLLEETLAKAEKLMDDGSRMSATIEQAAQTANESLVDLRPRAADFLDQMNITARGLEEEVDKIGEQVQAVLVESRPEIAESLRRLRRTMWEAELAMRKIRANPAFLLFGDSETLYDAESFDETGLRRTGRARPYEQRDENSGGK